MWTRKQYMDGECSHRTYYAQFVTQDVIDGVTQYFTLERLVKCGDQEDFNTIPLAQWNRIRCQIMRDSGESWMLGTAVCVLKEAARQLVEAHGPQDAS